MVSRLRQGFCIQYWLSIAEVAYELETIVPRAWHGPSGRRNCELRLLCTPACAAGRHLHDCEGCRGHRPLSAGSPISADSVALIDWPASMPLTGAFTKPEEVIGGR